MTAVRRSQRKPLGQCPSCAAVSPRFAANEHCGSWSIRRRKDEVKAAGQGLLDLERRCLPSESSASCSAGVGMIDAYSWPNFAD
jgi:hypothetical protein